MGAIPPQILPFDQQLYNSVERIVTDAVGGVSGLVETETEGDDSGQDENDERHVLNRFPDEVEKHSRLLGGNGITAEPLAPLHQILFTVRV